jgi:hypothetical protein
MRERQSVSDIFDEVDEEVRREQIKKLWDRYGNLFVALCLLIVVGVAGWRGYEYWQAKKAAETGAQFIAAALLAEQGKHEEAEKAFARVAAEGTSGYRVLARLREAAELAARDPKAAVAVYDDIAASSSTSQPLKDFAAVRAAMLLVDSAPLADISRRLEPIAVAGAPFRNSARELLAFASWKAGDKAATLKWAKLIREDQEAPSSLRQRVELLIALVGESGTG